MQPSNLPPSIDVTMCQVAYGRLALPMLIKHLASDLLIIRQRAILSLVNYFHDPEHIAFSLDKGIIKVLINLLCDNDPIVREYTAECFYILSTHSIGSQAIVNEKVLIQLSDVFNDQEYRVRYNIHKTFEMASSFNFVAEEIISLKLTLLLHKKLKDEETIIKCFILDTLHWCARQYVNDILEVNGMVTYKDCLDHESDQVRYRAARNIADLCQILLGKNLSVEKKVINRLVELLSDHSDDVKANAANAIMRISITTKGKYTVLEAQAILPLVQILSLTKSDAIIYSLKALTCLSEAPEGKIMLQEHLSKITSLTTHQLPQLRHAAKIAVERITWVP